MRENFMGRSVHRNSPADYERVDLYVGDKPSKMLSPNETLRKEKIEQFKREVEPKLEAEAAYEAAKKDAFRKPRSEAKDTLQRAFKSKGGR